MRFMIVWLSLMILIVANRPQQVVTKVVHKPVIVKPVKVEVVKTREITATYKHILKNKPRIDKQYAEKLADAIDKSAETNNIDPILLSAIFMQESSYKVGAKGCYRLRRYGKKQCLDFGIGQIYKRTARMFKFDRKRLLTDVDYSVEAGAKVLADFKRMYSKKETDWWTRYNSSKRKWRNKYQLK